MFIYKGQKKLNNQEYMEMLFYLGNQGNFFKPIKDENNKNIFIESKSYSKQNLEDSYGVIDDDKMNEMAYGNGKYDAYNRQNDEDVEFNNENIPTFGNSGGGSKGNRGNYKKSFNGKTLKKQLKKNNNDKLKKLTKNKSNGSFESDGYGSSEYGGSNGTDGNMGGNSGGGDFNGFGDESGGEEGEGLYNQSKTKAGGSTKRKRNVRNPVRKRNKPNSKYDAYSIEEEKFDENNQDSYGEKYIKDPDTGNDILIPVRPLHSFIQLNYNTFSNLVLSNFTKFISFLQQNVNKIKSTVYINTISKSNKTYLNTILYKNFKNIKILYKYIFLDKVFNFKSKQILYKYNNNKFYSNVYKCTNFVAIKVKPLFVLIKNSIKYNNLKKVNIKKYYYNLHNESIKYNKVVKGKYYVNINFNPILQGDLVFYKIRNVFKRYHKNVYFYRNDNINYKEVKKINNKQNGNLVYVAKNISKYKNINNSFYNNQLRLEISNYNKIKTNVKVVEKNLMVFVTNFSNTKKINEIIYYDIGQTRTKKINNFVTKVNNMFIDNILFNRTILDNIIFINEYKNTNIILNSTEVLNKTILLNVLTNIQLNTNVNAIVFTEITNKNIFSNSNIINKRVKTNNVLI